ncbi:hypothetical protein [uncultured Methanolobus sp.]|nr:hypothetical protein [uncultured Methanolobus sp.]
MELFWKQSNIVIAKRFNSIENADRILIPDYGKCDNRQDDDK